MCGEPVVATVRSLPHTAGTPRMPLSVPPKLAMRVVHPPRRKIRGRDGSGSLQDLLNRLLARLCQLAGRRAQSVHLDRMEGSGGSERFGPEFVDRGRVMFTYMARDPQALSRVVRHGRRPLPGVGHADKPEARTRAAEEAPGGEGTGSLPYVGAAG
jgi:hypothetical protein